MTTKAQVERFITKNPGKPDSWYVSEILEWTGDIWWMLQLLRELGWNFQRVESAHMRDARDREFFNDNREYIKTLF